MHEQFRMFAAYNAWANSRLYEAAGKLNEEEWRRDCGAFFGSMSRTLNHLLVADRIWQRRFTGAGPTHTALDEVPYEKLEALWEARQAEDRRIIAYIDGLDRQAVSGQFTYRPLTNPEPVTQRLASALSHLFNHQTHHRGQAHTILTILGKPAVPLDLIYFLRTPAGARFQ